MADELLSRKRYHILREIWFALHKKSRIANPIWSICTGITTWCTPVAAQSAAQQRSALFRCGRRFKKTLKNQHAIPAQRDVQVCLA